MNNQQNQIAIFNYSQNPVRVYFKDNEDWLNATDLTTVFGKRPNDFLSLPTTKRFLEALKSTTRFSGSDPVRVINGGNQPGTWLSRPVALKMAAWLDVKVEIAYMEYIENALINFQQPAPAIEPINEFLLQQELIRLASFTPSPLQQEQWFTDPALTVRFDVVEHSRNHKCVTVTELKVEKVTCQHIAEKFERKYIEMAKRKYPRQTVKFYFSSPAGIEESALEMATLLGFGFRHTNDWVNDMVSSLDESKMYFYKRIFNSFDYLPLPKSPVKIIN